MVAGGWDRASQMTPSSAICEMEALGELSASGDAYMVPTATNTFPIYYESNSTFELPTVLLLDSAGLDNMNGPAHFGEQDWILASQTKRRTPAWEVPVLIVPDPLDLNQLRDAEYGMYTSIASTGGTLDDVQLNPATYNLGEIELSSLWTTLTVEENGTNLVTVDASVSPDSLGLTPTDNLLSEYDAGKFYITPPDEDLALWREGSDVKVFNANTLKTTIELSPTNDFNDHELHIAFPITAPKFDPETLSDLSYSGADAVNNALLTGEFRMALEPTRRMYVRVRNELSGAYFDPTLTTTENPLLLKNCPHLMNDSIYMDIKVGQMNNSDGQLKFTGGDPVVISAAVLWATEGRRTMLWSDRDLEHNVLTMCTDISQDFAMQGDPQESQHDLQGDWTYTDAGNTEHVYLADDSVGVSHITLKWNHSSVAYSSGGTMRLQRRNYEDFGGTNNGWEYATGLAHRPWSFNAEDAKPFYNVDADANGNLDILSYTDSTLFHDMWSCETAEYRVEQDMCGDLFHTPSIYVSIQGNVSDPWKYVDELNDGVVVSEGRYFSKVQIDWSSAVDGEGLIDQFRLYRRLYTLPMWTMRLGSRFLLPRTSTRGSTTMWLQAPCMNTVWERSSPVVPETPPSSTTTRPLPDWLPLQLRWRRGTHHV